MSFECLAKKWESVIYSQENSFFNKFCKFLLALVSFFYGAAVIFRNKAYDFNFFHVRKVSVPVISIGNLSVGGSGKTALAIWCAEKFREKKKKVVLLSRGYKRKCSGNKVEIVSDGEKIFTNSALSGDEPYLIAQKLKDIPVVVGADRYESAKIACSQFKPDCIVLDDGFQHRKFHRDLNIVSLDDSILKAPYLFPRGVLRENVNALKRADFILIKTEKDDYGESFQKIFSFPVRHPVAIFRYHFSELREHQSEKTVPLKELSGKKVISCSAIAHPGDFEKLLKSEGAEIILSKRFPDHHYFTQAELEKMRIESEKTGAVIVTTEKDAVKIPKDFQVFVCGVKIEWIQGEEEFTKTLMDVLVH